MIHNDIRLLAVERFKTLDLQGDEEFMELVHMASDVCDTPIALITLIDRDTQWHKVKKGIDIESVPREMAFCTHAIEGDKLMIVEDATLDARFANNPIVAAQPNIRFYAGAPLVTKEGHNIGTLCVIDTRPHELSKHQQMMLTMLSRQAINLMEYRISLELLEQNLLEVEEQRQIIKKAEITLRSFFESAPNFHALLGKNGEILDYNKVAYNFVKKVHSAKMTRGSLFITFIAPDFVEKFLEGYNRALKGERVFEEGSTDYGQHGIIYWEASFETARDPNNEIIGISYIIRDVSDRKIKEQKILAQNKSLLKIAHLQAHEFRAPLTSVIGMLDLIKAEHYKAPQEYYEMLESAVQVLDEKIKEVVGNVDHLVLLNATEVYSG